MGRDKDGDAAGSAPAKVRRTFPHPLPMPSPARPPVHRPLRRAIRWAVLLTGGWLLLSLVVDRVVRHRLERAAQQAAGGSYTVRLGQVRAHLLRGSVEVRDASLHFDSLALDSLLRGSRAGLLRVHADRIALQGLSYWRLLRHGTVAMRAIDIQAPTIDHFMPPPHAAADSTTADTASEAMPLITVDTLRIIAARGGTNDLSGQRTSARVDELDILSGGITVVPRPMGGFVFRARSTTLAARGLAAAFPPLYDLRIASLDLVHPAGLARVTGATFRPRVDPQDYGRVVEFETDLFEATMDTLLLSGLDIQRFLVMQDLFMRRAELRSPVLSIHRDKTMPDGPFLGRRLPPAGLRHIPRALRIDSIIIGNGHVDYHERDTLGTDYGRVSFTALEAVLTGADNTPQGIEEGELQLTATARMHDQGRVAVRYAAPLRPGTSRFTLHAHVHGLPFRVFNHMTDSLLLLKVRDGRIDELVMHMQGDDDQATGTVDLTYADLRLELRSRDPRQPRNWIMDRALDLLVRRTNLRTMDNYRQGTFTVVRRKDRSIFNYAWRGLRAGTLDTMVPGILSRHAQQQANRKARRP